MVSEEAEDPDEEDTSSDTLRDDLDFPLGMTLERRCEVAEDA